MRCFLFNVEEVKNNDVKNKDIREGILRNDIIEVREVLYIYRGKKKVHILFRNIRYVKEKGYNSKGTYQLYKNNVVPLI